MNTRLRFILMLWVVLLIVGGAGAYWYLSTYNPQIFITDPDPDADPAIDPYFAADILSRSPAYEEVRLYLAAGNFEKVNELYIGLKANYATGTKERNVIDFDHAFFTTFSYGKPKEGIEMLRGIVLDSSRYNTLTRALAIESMARSVTTYSDPELTAQVFTGEPFEELLSQAQDSVPGATAALYEQAVKIQPTPLASARVAEAKARRLLNEKDTLSAEEATALRAEFDEAISLADASALVIQSRPGFNDYLGIFTLVKGFAYASIYYTNAQETDKNQADALFRKSIQLSQDTAQTFTLYHYALFLSRANSEGREAVDALVTRIMEAPAHNRKLIEQHFVNALKNTDVAGHEDVVHLMGYSQAFNAYVTNLAATHEAS